MQEYFRGDLARTRALLRWNTVTLTVDERARLSALVVAADAAWSDYEHGRALLMQKRRGPGDFSYFKVPVRAKALA